MLAEANGTVKIFLNFSALRIAQKSPDAFPGENLRFLGAFLQVADSERLE
jgi:hypothetical protein